MPASTSNAPDIRLRPVAESDLDLLRRNCLDPELSGLDWFGFGDQGNAARRLEKDGWLGESGSVLMAEVREADAGDGVAGLVSWHLTGHPSAMYPNIGILLVPEYRGRGIAAAALRLLCEYLFATRPYVRVEAGTQTGNLAAQRALEKAGFTREGVLRHAHFQGGRWKDLVSYSRLRDDPAPVD